MTYGSNPTPPGALALILLNHVKPISQQVESRIAGKNSGQISDKTIMKRNQLMRKLAMPGLATALMLVCSPTYAQIRTVYGNNAGGGPDVVEKFSVDIGAGTGTFLTSYTPSGGNGRGVVVVGNILYSTQVGDNHIYMTD